MSGEGTESRGRIDVDFASGGAICRAWLYRPSVRAPASGPCIVMAHGLGGTRDAALQPYAEKFSSAGYRVLLFDYRHFGASDGDPRQLFSIGRQLEDWASAIAYARSLDEVDADRVGLWGTSFSGGHVVVAAAKDGNIAAVSAQCPMMDALAASWNFVRYAGPTAFIRMVLSGILDQARAVLGMSPRHMLLVGEPGSRAVMCSHDAARGFRAIAPPDWRNEICARFALTFAQYRPIRYARRIRCPALIQVCLRDSLAPPRPAIATARRIGPHAELERYDCGHFDVYVGEWFERLTSRQVAFFEKVVPIRGRVSAESDSAGPDRL